MHKTLRELAELVDGAVKGDPETAIRGVAGMREAQKGAITFLSPPKYLPLMRLTRASAVVVIRGSEDGASIPLITVDNPDLAFAKIVENFDGRKNLVPPGIHPTAVIHEEARLGRDVAVGAHSVVEKGAEIGDGSVLFPQVYVGHDVKIGPKALIYPMVALYHGSTLGANVILHSGVVLGSDGFGYATVDGRHIKIPQSGVIVIEDDVEIGAGTAIARARFDKTIIRQGIEACSEWARPVRRRARCRSSRPCPGPAAERPRPRSADKRSGPARSARRRNSRSLPA